MIGFYSDSSVTESSSTRYWSGVSSRDFTRLSLSFRSSVMLRVAVSLMSSVMVVCLVIPARYIRPSSFMPSDFWYLSSLSRCSCTASM